LTNIVPGQLTRFLFLEDINPKNAPIPAGVGIVLTLAGYNVSCLVAGGEFAQRINGEKSASLNSAA
jgi:hypothetical protein